MTDLSTHLQREKGYDDPLEAILEPWGVWRSWGVDGLSSPRKSPLEGYNQLQKGYTDELDRARVERIRSRLSITLKGRALLVAVLREYTEAKNRINSLSVPRETLTAKPQDPKYGGHKYYSKIDRLLSDIHPRYYNILIHKYENNWENRDFIIQWGWTDTVTRKQVSRARKAAREKLKKYGYKA